MRYRLRTLLILLAVMPPLLAVGYWGWAEYKARQRRAEERFRAWMIEAEERMWRATPFLNDSAEPPP